MIHEKRNYFDSFASENLKESIAVEDIDKKQEYIISSQTSSLSLIGESEKEECYYRPSLVSESQNNKKTCISRFLIEHDCKWKGIFDFCVLVLVNISCLSILYLVSFQNQMILRTPHYVVEGIFGLSIILKFFHKYQDPNTMIVVSSYKKIAINYIWGWFILDFVSIIPYELFIINSPYFKLIRLVRFPKVIEFINIERFDKCIETIFSGTKNNKVAIIFNLRYAFKITRVVLIAIILTYIVGCIWYIYCYHMMEKEEKNFITMNQLEAMDGIDKLIITFYFALTTLTTVGYGDLTAISNKERLFAIFLMLLGVAIFSYVMGNFADLLSSYDKKFSFGDKDSDLENWLQLLSKFSKTKPLPSNLIQRIDKHFAFFWQNDRNASIKKNDPYFIALPKDLRQVVMDQLWRDIFNKFSNFFLSYKENKKKYSKFYYDIAFCFLPRQFFPGECIYKPNEEIDEMYLLLDGYVEIGFSKCTDNNDLNSVKFYKRIQSIDWIGEMYCLFNVKSKYYYMAGSDLNTLGIKKKDLNRALEKEQELCSKLRRRAYRRYVDYYRSFIDNEIKEDMERSKQKKVKYNLLTEIQIGIYTESEVDDKTSFCQKSVFDKENQANDMISSLDKKYIRLDDDFSNLSKYLFLLNLQSEKDIIRINSELDVIQKKLDSLIQSSQRLEMKQMKITENDV